METTASFGYWLHRQRKALDLTQQALAERVGCSVAAIKKIEGDERRPSRQIAERLADVLSVPISQRKLFLEVARGMRSVDQLSLAREPASPSLPSGTVTFLFTDIEGSTKLWRDHEKAMERAQARHHEILRAAIESNSGYIFQVIGDAFCAAFHKAGDALKAAVQAQSELTKEAWGEAVIKVRMGIHTGEAEIKEDGQYNGYLTMSRVKRLMSAGHGGQVLVSLTSEELIRDDPPPNVELRDLGEHRLKDLIRPKRIFQLVVPNLSSDFPPLNTLDAYQNNLPQQLTTFIGREKEIAEIKKELETHRLVTLTGSGGTGKTRLSLQVAADLLDSFPNGVWFVELAPILDPLLVLRTTAITIGLRETPQPSVIDMLCDYLHEKKMLIVLDNCEHLVAACAEMTSKILQGAPDVRILASSREVLGIAGEATCRVPSLKLPELDFISVELLTRHEATRLFIDRATTVLSTFSATDDNASAIAQICRRLDGIPLAIELAAAKVRVLSADQIAKRLDDRFRLLTGGSRTAMERHQTLQAAIDWSYNLLSPTEQILFRRLSVFVGGWAVEAAETVCSNEEATNEDALKEKNILELLTQLINKSLVTTEERNSEVRFRMLETIRQYAHEKLLKSGDTNEVKNQHLEYFVKLSEEAELKLLGSDQLIWIDRLEYELDNLRAALEWSLKSGHVMAGLQLAGAMWRFWDIRNIWSESRGRLEALLSHQESAARTRERAKALYAAGLLAQLQSDHASASSYYSEGLAISRELKDKRATGYCLVGLARTWRRYRGDRDARLLLDECLEIFREINDKWGTALSLEWQGNVALEQDDFATAHSYRAKSIKIFRELGDKISLSFALAGLAYIMVCQGNYGQSEILYEECLTLFREMRHKGGIAYSLNSLGEVARCQGDYDRAKVFYEESLEVSREIGDKARVGASLHNLGYVSQHQGNYHQAITLFTEGLILSREVNDTLAVAVCLVGLASQIQGLGYPQYATRLFGAAQPLFDASSHRFAPADQIEYQRNLAATRFQLDDATFESAFADGQKMSLDDALDLVSKTVDKV